MFDIRCAGAVFYKIGVLDNEDVVFYVFATSVGRVVTELMLQ